MAARSAQTPAPMTRGPRRHGWFGLPGRGGDGRRVGLSIWLPLGIFVLTRLHGFVVIALAARHQVALPSPEHPLTYQFTAHPASPGYLGLITNWDGQWYEAIATLGYHLPGPGDPGASNTLWTFAFLPVFPFVVGAMMAVTGLSFAMSATVINLVAGGAAMVVMFALVEPAAGRFAATAAVLFTCSFISAPLFQAAYSESISLLLVCTALLLIARRRYGWAIAVVVLLSFTRLVTPPLAVVVLVHAVVRYRHRAQDPIRRAEVIGMAALAVVSLASVTFWSRIVALVTSDAEDLGTSRRGVSSVVASGRFGWFTNAYEHIGWIAVIGLALLSVVLVAVAVSPFARSWGVEVRTWFAIYPIFLLFAAGVHYGMFRYLLLAFPLGLLLVGSPAPAEIPRKRAALVVTVAVIGLALQVFWVNNALMITEPAGNTWLP